jgi:hypothetical protein
VDKTSDEKYTKQSRKKGFKMNVCGMTEEWKTLSHFS